MNPVHHQLLLVKYLHLKGEYALSEKGLFSAGLAVSLFQDAVESLIGTIAKEVGATIPAKVAFDAYWGLIKDAPNARGRQLPPNGKMIQLNTARVSFKHHGNVPSVPTAVGLQLYTEQFLSEACSGFFSVDFRTLSAVDLVQATEVAGPLRIAWDAFKAGSFGAAVEECAKAYHYLDRLVNEILPSIPVSFESMLSRTAADADYVGQRLNDVENAIAAVRNLLVATSLSIPLADFRRFQQMSPLVIKHEGELKAVWISDRNAVAAEDVEFAVRYVTDFALALQRV